MSLKVNSWQDGELQLDLKNLSIILLITIATYQLAVWIVLHTTPLPANAYLLIKFEHIFGLLLFITVREGLFED